MDDPRGVLEVVLALAAGIGLAAACGLRVFAPLFVLGLAVHFGRVSPAPGFDWIGSMPGLVVLGAATAVEIAAYYVPWLDNALDSVATPVALVAGAAAMVAVLGDFPPWLRWSLGLVAGGGLAGLTQGATVLFRLKSLALTGGLGNPVVATLEWLGALLLATLAVFLPLLALVAAVLLVVAVFSAARRIAFGRRVRA